MSRAGCGVAPVGGLLERERELEAIGELLVAACECSGRMLVLEGAAGVGKSRLLAAGAVSAAEAGMTVLTARGEELERSAPWGLVRRMLAPVGTAAVALSDESTVARAAAAADDVLRVANQLFWVIADLAESGPVLLVVDDAQWADE